MAATEALGRTDGRRIGVTPGWCNRAGHPVRLSACPPVRQTLEEMRETALQIAQSSGASARARVISSNSSVTWTMAGSNSGAVRRDVAAGPGDDRPARRSPCPLRSRRGAPRPRRRRAPPRCPGPGGPSGRDWRGATPPGLGRQSAGRRGARNQDQLGAVEGRQGRHQRVPGVLADQERGSGPTGCRRPGCCGPARRSAPRRRRRRSAGRPCDGRGGCRRRCRRGVA